MTKALQASALVCVLGLMVGCDNASNTDASEAYLVSWSPKSGFFLDGTDMLEINALAIKVKTPTPILTEAERIANPTPDDNILWVVGDGVSMPFFGTTFDHLPKDQAWPDVVIPATLANQTKLTVYSVLEGKLDKRVTDVTVKETVLDNEVAYSFEASRSKCGNYCSSTECGNNCKWCSSCASGSCSYSTFGKTRSTNMPCSNMCGSCALQSPYDHYCWTISALVTCR
jgi:hypothetical protein